MATTVAKLMIELGANTSGAQAALNQFGVGLGNVGRGAQTAGKNVNAFGLNLDRAATRLGSISRLGGVAGNVLSLGVAAGFAGASIAAVGFGVAVTKAVQAGIAFESAFAGVEKTVQGTDAELAKIRNQILSMSTEIPQTAIQLSRIGEAAGQLGVDAAHITEFTRVVADLGVTTNLASEDAATGLARLINITQGSFDEIENLGSALVHLGNTSATTEAEILSMSLRIAGAGHQVGLTEAEVLGFATALSSVGVRAEAGGSAISRVFIEIDKAVTTGSEKLQFFADVANMSTQELVTLWEQDAAQATVKFAEGLNRLDTSGQDVFGTLEQLGLNEIRVRDALLRLAGAGDLTAESIEKSNQAFKEGTALASEAEKRYDTTASKVQILRNAVNTLAVDIFDALKPAIDETVVGLTDLVLMLDGVSSKLTLVTPLFTEMSGVFTNQIRIFESYVSAGDSVIDMLVGMDVGTNQASTALLEFGYAHLTPMGQLEQFADRSEKGAELIRNYANELNQAQFIRQLSASEEAAFRAEIRETAQLAALLVQGVWSDYADVLYRIRTELREDSNATTDFGKNQRDAGAAAATFTNSLARQREELVQHNLQVQDQINQQNMLIDAAPRAGQQVAGAWDQIFNAAQRAMDIDPASLTDFMDDLVEGVRTGQVEIERVFQLIGDLPEDTTGELIEDLQKLQLEFLETAGSTEATASEIRDAEGNIRVLDQVIKELEQSLDGIQGRSIDLSAAFNMAGEAGDVFGDQMSTASGILSDLEAEYERINEKKDEGLGLTEREQDFLAEYPALYDRLIGYQDDATQQAGEWAAIQGEIILAQDAVNEKLGEAPGKVADAARSVQDFADRTGGLTEEQRKLLEKLLGVETTLAGLDGQEANIAVNLLEGASAGGPSGGGPTRFEQRAEDLGITGRIRNAGKELLELDGSSADITADITDNATGPLDGITHRVQWLKENGSFTLYADLDTSGFDAGTQHIARNTPHSPAEEGPLAFTPNWDYLFEGIEASASKYTKDSLDHLSNYVSTAKSIFDTLAAELDFAGQASEFQTGGGALPELSFISGLADFSESVTRELGESAAIFKEEFLDHAKIYADSAKSGIDLLSEAVGFIADLEGVTINLDRAMQAASDLKFLTEHIVLSVGDSAMMIENGEGSDHPAVRGAGFTGVADNYAQGAKSSVELIGVAADELAGLDEFTINLDRARRAASDLKFLTEDIVLFIGDSAMIINSEVDHPSARGEGFVGIAKEYSEGAREAVGLVGDALGFISDLADFEGEFNLVDAKQFASDLKFLIEHIVLSIGDAAAALMGDGMNESRPEDFLTGMQAYAESAGPALDLLDQVIGILEGISEYKDGINLTTEQVRDVALGAAAIARIVAEGFRTGAAGWDDAGISISDFADSADTSLGLIDGAMEAVEQIVEFDPATGFDGVTVEKAQAFALGLAAVARIIAEGFRTGAAGWSEAEISISDFAESAGSSLDLIDGAMDAVEQIVGFNPDEGFQGVTVEKAVAFAEGLGAIARIVAEGFKLAATGWTDVDDEAQGFYDAASNSLGLVGDVVDIIEDITGLSDEEDADDKKKKFASFREAVDQLASDIRYTVDVVAGMAEDFTGSIEDWQAFAEAARESVNLVGDAAKAFNDISEMSKLTAKDTQLFRDNFQVVLDLVGGLDDMAQAYLDDAITFNELMKEIAQALESAADAIDTAAGSVSSSANNAQSGSGSGGGGAGGPGLSPNPLDPDADQPVASLNGGGGAVGVGPGMGLPPGVANLLSNNVNDIALVAQILGMSAELVDHNTITVTGENKRFLQALYRSVRDSSDAILVHDADGKTIPDHGFTYSESGTHFLTGEPTPAYINPFANGGIITDGPILGMLGDNRSKTEAIVPLERAHEFGFGGGPSINIEKLEINTSDAQNATEIQRIVEDALQDAFMNALSTSGMVHY